MSLIKTKDELLEQISLAVEQIQKQYVPGQDIIKDSEETSFLCKYVDDILHHGLKEGLISWATEPSAWPLLEKITCTEDVEEIKKMHLKTDKEKCCAWIKMAVNVNLLGSYITTLHHDRSLLSHYYDYAFLRDPILTSTVESLLNYGIANFNFDIIVNHNRTPETNIFEKQEVHMEYDSYEKETNQNNDDSVNNTTSNDINKDKSIKKKRKKKKLVNNVVISDVDNELLEGLDIGLTNGHSSNEGPDDDTKPLNKAKLDHIESSLDTGINLRTRSPPHKSIIDSSNSIKTTENQGENRTVMDIAEIGAKDEQTVGEQAINVLSETNDCQDSKDRTRRQEPDDTVRNVNILDRTNEETEENTLADTVDSNNDDNSRNIMEEQQSSVNPITDNVLRITNEERGTCLGTVVTTNIDSEVVTNARPSLTDTGITVNMTDINTDSRQVDDSELSSEPSTQEKEGEFGSYEVEDYLLGCRKGDTQEATAKQPQASETISNNSISNTEFSPSDFLLEKSSSAPSERSSSDASDIEVTSKYSNTKLTDSRNSTKADNSKSVECCRSPTSQNRTQTAHDCRQSPPDYRVKKVENPEFVSSSYSSSYSDVTDTSYDDRDLNYIPGIHTHKQPSSYKSGSSCDRENSLSFDEHGFPMFDTSHFTDSSSRPSSIDDTSDRFAETSSEWDMFDDYLNMEEEHFAGPDNFAGLTTSEELEIAIKHYKELIKANTTKSRDRDELIKKLIKLRLRLQQEKEGPVVDDPEICKVVSHRFQKEEHRSSHKIFCDQCGKIIWSLWQPLLTCKDCGYHSHKKCMEHIKRLCPIRTLSSVSYIMDICPDAGLDAQQHRCVECRKPIATSRDGVSEARICDYTGQYYCDQCHWNDQICIPARVIQNWDFVQYKVCRQSKQLLDLTKTKPLLNLKEANPMLFRYVEELREVAKLRGDILIMKKYFLTCRAALESKLLIQLQKRQHFVDSADIYSLQDILDLNNDVLLPEISKIHALFLAHIKADCQLCRARGFICEVCRNSSDVIFAFDPHAIKCTGCSAVFHKVCFKPEDCPKCERKKKVLGKS